MMPLPNEHEPDWPTFLGDVQVNENILARMFADANKDRFAYCHSRDRWYTFDGGSWHMQATPTTFEAIRKMCEMVVSRNGGAVSILKAKSMESIEKLAARDPLMAKSNEDWNKDKFLLGSPTGSIDLRTGKMVKPSPRDLINKSVAVTPDEFEECPTWHRFLEDATGGDEALIRYLQQIAGYALTGDVSEQCLFFIYGKGGNGKGVFANTLLKIMGEYGVQATMEAFEKQAASQHTTDLAMLNGARLVTASETEEGAAWNEKRIKAITGEDRLTARFMRKDNIEFDPTFTLLIIGNHKPTLRTVDEAIRRRFNIIPFKIKPKKKDPKLGEKLQAEWPSILRWAINGCLDWQENGLVRPNVVKQATDDYFDEQNTIQHWMSECCRVERDNAFVSASSSALYASWRKYAQANGVAPGDTRQFRSSMEREEFVVKRTKMGAFWEGIALLGSGDSDQ